MAYKNNYSLDNSYTRCNFQLSAELIVKDSLGGCVKYNGCIIYNWAKNKFGNLRLPKYICSFSNSFAGLEVNTIYDPDKPYFCMKASHPDMNINGIPGRQWTTEAEIIVKDEKVLLGVRVLYTTPVSQNCDNADFSIPNFVRTIYEINGIKDVWQLQSSAHFIDSIDIDDLYNFIQNDQRNLPVVVITEKEDSQEIGSQYQSGYLIDGNKLASNIGIIAHVVCLNSNSAKLWTDKVGRDWSVYNGAIRTYYPGVDFNEPTYMNHPLTISNSILASSFEKDDGTELIAGEAFEIILEEKLERNNTKSQLDWNIIGHKFYNTIRREELLHRKEDDENTKELVDIYEETLRDTENELDLITSEKESLKGQLDKAQTDIYYLRGQVDNLRDQLNAISDEKDSDIPILDNYNDLPKWIEKYFSGKLYLLPKAKNALKKAQFEDVKMVYKSLKLLGTTYYQMRTGMDISRADFDSECSELGVEESQSITSTSKGELGDTYTVIYNNEKHTLDRHLKYGVTREPRECMRIYFFWDEDASLVVIGSLPQHLKIKSS